MMALFCRNRELFSQKISIIDVWLGSKYVSNTFVNFIVIYGSLHIILDFYMAPRSHIFIESVNLLLLSFIFSGYVSIWTAISKRAIMRVS